jgi:uncharacterized protein (DUF58 family)
VLELEPDLLRKLDRVTLTGRWQVDGSAPGPRRSVHHGSSPEFADFRNYVEGDDLRRVDWNAYARLDQLFVRLHTGEEMGTLTLLLDRSPSMQTSEPHKSLAAARVAAALSYIGLRSHDRVALVGWSGRIDRQIPPQAGVRSLRRLWDCIEDIMARPGSPTDFSAMRSYRAPGPGTVVVISDFLTETDVHEGLQSLALYGDRVAIIQILGPEELHPDFAGDWQLIDVESDASVDVTVAQRSVHRYLANLAEHTEGLRETCRRLGVAFVRLSSADSLQEVLIPSLLSAGVVR